MNPSPTRVAARVGLVAVRIDPGRAAEQSTEVLCGEPLEVLERVMSGEDAWLRVRGEDAYEGWVPQGPMVEVPSDWPGPRAVRVVAREVTVADPTTRTPRRVLPHGVILPFQTRTPEEVRVQLPGGEPGLLDPGHVTPTDAPSDPESRLGEEMTAFMGAPYRWGGRSVWGVDCSGLVQRLVAALGVMLPRDSYQQEEWLAGRGPRLDRTEVGTGVVLFWGGGERATHTALALDADRFLHARDWVRVGHWSSGPDADLVPRFRGAYRLPAQPGSSGE